MASVRAVLAGSACIAVLLAVARTPDDDRPAGVASAPPPTAPTAPTAPPTPPAHPPPRHRLGHFPGDRIRSLSGSPGFWWIGANSTGSAGVPNSGVQAILQAVSYAPTGGCFDCWTSEYLTNDYWGQIGFSTCDPIAGPGFEAFYQVWNTSASAPVNGGFLVAGETSSLSTGDHLFTMSVVSGTTWAFALDGVVFGTYDMGSAVADEASAISTWCEEGNGVAAPFVPPQVEMPVVMDVLQGGTSGTWTPVAAGEVYNSAGLSGVVGHLQDAGPDDSVVVGGDSPYLEAGTPLWTSASGAELPDAGPATNFPPSVTIATPVAGAVVSGTVLVVASASASASTGSIASVVFQDDTGATLATDTAAPYDLAWDTSGLADGGSHYVQALAKDEAGNATLVTIYVNVVPGAADAGPAPDAGEGDAGHDTSHDAGEDAGNDAGNDAGAADAGSSQSSGSGSTSGCSCDLARHSSRDATWALFGASLAASVALRRARRGRHPGSS